MRLGGKKHMKIHPHKARPEEFYGVHPLSKFSWFSITPSPDGGRYFDAGVDPGEVGRLANEYRIPSEPLANWLRFLLLNIVVEEFDRGCARVTRRQLLGALSALTRIEGSVPKLPEWLVDELKAIESDRISTEMFGGPAPLRPALPLKKAPVVLARLDEGMARVRKSLEDLPALKLLALDARRHVASRGETNREYYAKKAAWQPNKTAVAERSYELWTRDLGRPRKVTDDLIAFTEQVYRLAGMELELDAMKKQLHRAAAGMRPS
jgi:hypothetical protein